MMSMQDRNDTAIVIVSTAANEPQVAVVNEPVMGNILLVTPSSYSRKRGVDFLICLRRIGVGLGKKVKASTTASLLLTA